MRFFCISVTTCTRFHLYLQSRGVLAMKSHTSVKGGAQNRTVRNRRTFLWVGLWLVAVNLGKRVRFHEPQNKATFF